MTREDVLSGVKFKWNNTVYVANLDKDDPGMGSLLSCIGKARVYECNVSSFGPYALHWYSYVMGKQVKGIINYKNLEPHIAS